MALNRPRRAPRGQQATTQPLTVPAPVGGINGADSLSAMSPKDSIYSYNLVPNEYGLQTRKGYKQHVTTLGGLTHPVCNLIPFAGQDGTNKLFATTKLGIYDVTTSAASPALVLTFGTQTGNAGYGSFCAYNNDGGEYFLLYADTLNGLFQYTPGTNTWAQVTDITGVAETGLVFVMEHKERLWFVEKDTMNAWYTGLGVKAGAATKFNVGNKFPHGGSLRGIYRWSVDGGNGVDDFLVFISSAGDIAVFSGTDPSAATTWQAVGTWTVGKIPDSKTVAENIGGELHILSSYGILSMQDLVGGVAVEKITGQNSVARRITRFVKIDMVEKLTDPQWKITPIMSEGIIVVTRPYDTGETPIQYVFSFTTAGWGFWRDLPINCIADWEGNVYFGDGVGNVHIMRDSKDGVLRNGTGGTSIEFSFLTAYSDFGIPGNIKRPHFARPRFFSEHGVSPAFSVKFLFDYDIFEPSMSLPAILASGSLWGVGTWGSAIWGGVGSSSSRTIGGAGQGYSVALALKGETNDRCTFLDSIVYSEVGGMLL